MHEIHIAGIGSRGLNAEQLEHCEKLGGWITQLGFHLHSGGAVGADQAFQRGGASKNPALVHIHVPWSSYEQGSRVNGAQVDVLQNLPSLVFDFYEGLAMEHHPAWGKLTQGGAALHTRNGRIIQPIPHLNVDLVLAWPSDKIGGGGTGQGMRMAKALGIPVIDLSKFGSNRDFHALCEGIKSRVPKYTQPRTTVISRAKAPSGWEKDPQYVYVGRPSIWGNPFTVEKYGQGGACEMHAAWFPTDLKLKAQVKELKGKTLVCYCHPKRCHGDLLARYADR